MSYPDYSSEHHINLLDEEFDSSMAGLNHLLDQALNKKNLISDHTQAIDSHRSDDNIETRYNGPIAGRINTQFYHNPLGYKDSPQFGSEGNDRDYRETSPGLQALIQQTSCVSLYNQSDIMEKPIVGNNGSPRRSPKRSNTGPLSELLYKEKDDIPQVEISDLQLEFKINNEKSQQSPSNPAKRSRAQTEQNSKLSKKDDILLTKPATSHQRWISQHSFTPPPFDYSFVPENQDGSGTWSIDWIKNDILKPDLSQKYPRGSHNEYQKSRTASRTSEDNLQMSFHTDPDARTVGSNKAIGGHNMGINRFRQLNAYKKNSEEMEQIGECIETENRSPKSISNPTMRQKSKSNMGVQNVYGIDQPKQEDLGMQYLNKTPKQREVEMIYYGGTECNKSYTSNNSHTKQQPYRKPSIVQSPSKVSPMESRSQTPQNSCTPNKSNSKHRRPLSQLLDENIGEYERNMDYIGKYTTQDVIESLDRFPSEKKAVIDSIIKSPRASITLSAKKEQGGHDEDLLDRIIIVRSPNKDEEVDSNLIPIYQQVSEEYDDGTKYYGEKLLGKRHGKGTYYYKEGYKYEGNWEQDQMCGFGILWLTEDLKWYEGEWQDNLFHGKGSLYNLYPDPLDANKLYLKNLKSVESGWVKYEGQFDKGLKDGIGSLYLTNGDFYIGNFRENKVHGRGSYTKPDRFVVVGNWADDELKETY